ncbi:MAG: DUF429 domain-containing protein [Luminiphilus sp.]|nr:DUF429 domain-containing protein [Luminiphilus sp.]
MNNSVLPAVGIDGCRAGWIIAYRHEGCVALRLFTSLAALNERLASDASVMIDMPIGLHVADSVRQCDVLARRCLSPYRSTSVFGVPPRPITRIGDYAEANAASRELTGKGLSKQSFYLFPKIREVDDWLINEHRQGRWSECHPEVAFASLNGGLPLEESKKTDLGRQQRIDLLREVGDVDGCLATALEMYPRRALLADDCVDALVCLLTAERPQSERIAIPDNAFHDARGLAMQIVAPAVKLTGDFERG